MTTKELKRLLKSALKLKKVNETNSILLSRIDRITNILNGRV